MGLFGVCWFSCWMRIVGYWLLGLHGVVCCGALLVRSVFVWGWLVLWTDSGVVIALLVHGVGLILDVGLVVVI